MTVEEKIKERLKGIYDPEIPINIVDLGLIYEIHHNEGKANIIMTLTSPACPVGEMLRERVKQEALKVEEVNECTVEVTFEPAWDPQKHMSEEAKFELGIETFHSPEGSQLSQDAVYDLEQELRKNEECRCAKCHVSEMDAPLVKIRYKKKDIYYCLGCLDVSGANSAADSL